MKMKKQILIGSVITLLFLNLISADAGEGYGGCMFGGFMGFGGGFFMWIFYILTITGLILLIAFLIKQIQK